MNGAPLIEAVGDQAFHLKLGDGLSTVLHERVMVCLAALDATRPAVVTDVIPGHGSILVIYDGTRAGAVTVRRWLEGSAMTAPHALTESRLVVIPVLYHPDVAPDLEALAAEKRITVAELVTRHCAPEYRVHMLGFRPGFPFLGGLDPFLSAARLPSPRLSVPAGSVAIGGPQTGIYPSAGPGGWRPIGRTPMRLFDPSQSEPCALAAGDRVRFQPIEPAGFEAMLTAWPTA